MAETDGAYRTTDMTFATVLVMHGYNPVMENIDTTRICWVVGPEYWDERIEELEDEYRRGACLVEPARFMREVRNVRQRMYELLGVQDKPRGSRIRQAPSV